VTFSAVTIGTDGSYTIAVVFLIARGQRNMHFDGFNLSAVRTMIDFLKIAH